MGNIMLEIEDLTDDQFDEVYSFVQATAAFMAFFLRVEVSVDDGYGTTTDHKPVK